MTTFPNREHEKADNAARRRAGKALDEIESEIGILRHKLARTGRADTTDGDDSQLIASKVRDLIQHLTALGVLRDVREWHAADMAEANQALTGNEKRELGMED